MINFGTCFKLGISLVFYEIYLWNLSPYKAEIIFFQIQFIFHKVLKQIFGKPDLENTTSNWASHFTPCDI